MCVVVRRVHGADEAARREERELVVRLVRCDNPLNAELMAQLHGKVHEVKEGVPIDDLGCHFLSAASQPSTSSSSNISARSRALASISCRAR